MKIKAININYQQNQAHIILDNGMSISIFADLVLKKHLHVDEEIEQESLNKLVYLSIKLSLRQQLLRLIAIRQRSESELKNKAKFKFQQLINRYDNFNELKIDPAKLINEVILDLKSRDYINDEKLAENLIDNYLVYKSKGLRYINLKLIKIGIDKKIILKLIDKNNDNKDKINNSIDKSIEKLSKIIKLRKYPSKEARQFMIKRILSRGYGYEEARLKIDEWLGREYNKLVN